MVGLSAPRRLYGELPPAGLLPYLTDFVGDLLPERIGDLVPDFSPSSSTVPRKSPISVLSLDSTSWASFSYCWAFKIFCKYGQSV